MAEEDGEFPLEIDVQITETPLFQRKSEEDFPILSDMKYHT